MIANLLRKTYKIFQSKLNPSTTPDSRFLAENPKYSPYQIGQWTYGNPAISSWNDNTTLKIGNFCSISEGVTILLGGEHRTDWVTTYPFNILFKEAKVFEGHPSCEEAKIFEGHPISKGNVIIGNDVWIGREAIILSGVTIGNGAVIAARSVVTKNIDPYSIVAGNPARHIKYRFSPEIIDRLQEIAWWDWPLPKIRGAWPLLLSNDIEQFLNLYKEK